MTVIRKILLALAVAYSTGLRDIDSASRSSMGALQRDMKMVGDITICTGLKRYIACTEGSNLAITKAFWGRISDKVCPSDDGDPVTDCDGSEDTLPLVKGYCDGKRECKLEARHTLLQKNGTHHCPGVNKYLVVNYTCIPESKGVTLCDSAETTLMCEAGWVIEIADIFWGRRSHAKYCGAEEGMECDSSETAAKYVRNQCDGKRKCPVKADATVLDSIHSPCSGILKYLMINYVCKPPEKDTEEEEEKEATKILQDPSSKELMGLLENHLSEIKPGASSESTAQAAVPPAAAQVREPKAAKQEANEEKKYNNQQRKASYSTNKGKKAMLGRSDPPSAVNENEDLSSMLQLGNFDNSVKKQEVPDYDKNSKKADSPKAPTPKSVQKKNEVVSFDSFLNNEQAVTGTTKDLVPKTKELKDDVAYEITEPTTVRSILARAKEVLKTLDNDANVANDKVDKLFLEKREGIARKKNETELEIETENAVTTVANLAKSLANSAGTKRSNATIGRDAVNAISKTIIQQSQPSSASIMQITKPRPGVRKSGLSGPGMAGMGNTP